jgi:glycosyltransferase involved in cell wall biosynthesis
MRIVMVAPQIGSAFGQEKVVARSTELLEKTGCEVFTVADRSFGEAADLELPGLSSFHALSPKAQVRLALNKLNAFLGLTKPDVIHVHDAFDPVFVSLLARRAPLVFTPHTVSFSCPSSTRLKADGKVCEKRSGWSCIAFHQSFGCLDGYRSTLHRVHLVHGYLTRVKALKVHAKRVIAISDYVSELLLHEGWSGVEKVPNPVWVEPWVPMPPSNQTEFVYAARITPMKGLADLLTSLSMLKNQRWALKVCGDGSERQKMEQLAQALGLGDRVEFLGRLEPNAATQLISSAAALVAPNRGPETFGLSVAEACFMGVPVIASKVRGLDEIIRDETEGYLFENGDLEGLKNCLENILIGGGEAYKRALKAKESVQTRFSNEQHSRKLLAVYRQAMIGSLKSKRPKNALRIGSPSRD